MLRYGSEIALRGRVNDEGEFAFGKGKTAGVRFDKGNGPMRCQMGGFAGEGFGIPGDDSGIHSELERVVGPGEALQQPGSDKASAPGNKDRGATEFGHCTYGL